MSADFISVGWVILGNMSPQMECKYKSPPLALGSFGAGLLHHISEDS